MQKWMALALLLCLLLAGCGGEDTDGGTTQTVPDIPQLPDLKVEECYTYTENGDGTYSYSVKGRSGLYICDVRNSKRSAQFAADGDDLLIIYGTTGTGVGARWATVCNIATSRMSDTFNGFLTAKNSRVAFVEQRTGAYHVFVCDPFIPNEYEAVYTLEGLVTTEGDDIVKDFKLGEDDVLTVTYPTKSGDKTITISMADKREE